jgi:hypothetical protein
MRVDADAGGREAADAGLMKMESWRYLELGNLAYGPVRINRKRAIMGRA